jgi:hypothetical protein
MSNFANQELEKDNEILIEKLSVLYIQSKEKVVIHNMVQRKINETPIEHFGYRESARVSKFTHFPAVRWAAAAVITIFGISTASYMLNKTEVNGGDQSFSKNHTQSMMKEASIKPASDMKNVSYIASENLIVYQF